MSPLIADWLSQHRTILHLPFAVLLGALIGMERQWRQRAAGLRTNTLVCLGAASFVDLAGRIGSPAGLTQVTAYVVSGVGFLGAGAIMKEGVNIRGLNTAATLWCAAAVGACVGADQPVAALATCGLVVAVNLILRLRGFAGPIDRRGGTVTDTETAYTVRVYCRAAEEARVRSLLLHSLGETGLMLRELDSADTERPEIVRVLAQVTAPRRNDAALESAIGRLSLEPAVSGAQWSLDRGEDADGG